MRAARLLGACTALVASAALAQPYTVSVTQSVTHDSNLLRVEDGQALPDGTSRSDTTYATQLQAGFDRPFGRQRAYGTASLQHTRFERNSRYDTTGHRLGGGLDWSTVGGWSGLLRASVQRSLAQFSNDEAGILSHANTQRTREADHLLRLGAAARWSAEWTLGWRDLDFSAPEFTSRAFRQTSTGIGIRRGLPGTDWVSVGWRELRGSYPHFRALGGGLYEADRFRRQELELKAALRTGGASDLSLRLGLGHTRYDTSAERNISGAFGSVDWSWRPTGALGIRMHASRDPAQDSYFMNTLFGRGTLNYDRVATLWQLKLDWLLTAKTSFHVTWGSTWRSLTRTIGLEGATLTPVRSDDRTDQAEIGVRWQPTRALQLGLDVVQEQRREATSVSRPYHATTVNAFGQLTLE